MKLWTLLLVPGLPSFLSQLPRVADPGTDAVARSPVLISLEGTWQFELDPGDVGIRERWYARQLSRDIQLPGSLQARGVGDPITVDTKWMGNILDRSWFTAPEYEKYRQPGNIKVPFWLQPETYYAGVAWYQRDVEIPEAWRSQRVVLRLERPHWETRVWLDDRWMGTQDALATPHEVDLGTSVAPGRHRLAIRVDNRLVVDVGIDSHSISDHTQGNWNGIVGQICLLATPPVWIDDLQVYPSLARELVTVRGRIGNATGKPGKGTLVMRVEDVVESGFTATRPPVRLPVTWQVDGASFETEVAVSSPRSWDEFQPVLHGARAWIEEHQDPAEARVVTFGFREIATQGTQFLVNGRKTFFRGTLECAIFPGTGHPPMDVDSWKRILRTAKAHGLNQLRFHSWCPPEAAFLAADELGFYYHVECSSWANASTTLGDGKPVDTWVRAEADRILKHYGNHPSFVLMLYGNEPGGSNEEAFLARWVSHYRTVDPRRLHSSGAGWPQLGENQFHVTPDPRIQAWGGGLKSRINARPPETRTDYRDYIQARKVPVISHEIGQWCVYPNFDEISRYTGYLKPKNFEIFREALEAHHLGDQARAFLFASGKLQALCYKEEIESALRTPGMGGFQLLDLHDFPGQGTALVGVLDAFWESKGYISPKEFRRFCNTTVPLARLDKRVFTTDETLAADVEVAHFGQAPLRNVRLAFQLVGDDGKIAREGQLGPRDVPVDNGVRFDPLNLDLHGVPAPARYRLVIGLEGTPFENDWDVWVYPPRVDTAVPKEIVVVDDLTSDTLAALHAGRKILYLVPPGRLRGDSLGKVELGFSSIFWNTAWTRRQAPHTLGILCDPKHPVFAAFPTDGYTNWQWWYLLRHAGAMILDGLPTGLGPTVQVIDDWFTARKLGLLFEGKVGSGRILVCSIDLRSDLELNLVARQFLHSVVQYMCSETFAPAIELADAQLLELTSATAAASPGR